MRFLPELENVLQSLVDEHRRLLAHVEAHQAAMRAFDLRALDEARNHQEASRLRVATLENRRKLLVLQIAKALKLDPAALTVRKLAELHPPRREALLKLRGELKTAAELIAVRTHVAGRLAGAVL